MYVELQRLREIVKKQSIAIQKYKALIEKAYIELEAYKRALKYAIEELGAQIPEELLRGLDLSEDEEIDKVLKEKREKARERYTIVLEVVRELIAKRNGPVHYNDVVEACRKREELREVSVESITRALRKLAEEGYLSRPMPGWYFLGPKAVGKQKTRERREGETLEKFFELF